MLVEAAFEVSIDDRANVLLQEACVELLVNLRKLCLISLSVTS